MVNRTLDAAIVRRRVTVTGAVQGVGFRPFAFRLAEELALTGFTGNDPRGAFVEVEGSPTAVERFLERLTRDAPPLARIETVSAADVAVRGDRRFVIVESVTGPGERALIPPDTATCDACLAEINDPADRRFRHPFANCTDCGPRFTIIRDLPYDRPTTTMAGFPMCPACAAEYGDPARSPLPCPADLVPRLRPAAALRRRDGDGVDGTDAAIAAVHAAWAAGRGRRRQGDRRLPPDV